MPVPTYVPTRGAGHRSSVVEGWNRPRSPSRPDDFAEHLNYLEPSGDTDLYDRPDWPLPSPTPKQSFMDGSEGLEPPLENAEEDKSTQHPHYAIGGQLDGTAYMGEPDVSDIEEVSEEEDEPCGAIGPAGNGGKKHVESRADEDDDDDEENVVIHTGTAQVAQRLNCRHSLRRPASYLAGPRAGSSTASSPSHRPTSRDTNRSVSPIRETIPDQPPLVQGPPVPISKGRLRLVDDDEEGKKDEVEETFVTPDERVPQPFEEALQPQPSSPIPQQASISIPSTPRTNGSSRHTDGNGLLDPSDTGAVSQWRMSVHNPHTTTQIPHNRERHRYSWQSIMGDEPNRPRIHIIKLVSNTATASAGFPQGEAFAFSLSPKGRRIAAYNSARLFVLQTAALPVGISQDYSLKRRPLAVELTDEGRVMAILADDHTVNVYELGPERMRLVRTITLDFPATCIALAPTGGLLAASYEGGVEIFSLDPSALSTDRRAVRAIKMDRMMFSEDGSTLLGTTTRINVASTVVVSVPIFPSSPDGIPSSEELKEAWCAELLHPENIRHSSHATFMRENRKANNERLFSWNGLEDTFGILNVGGMQYENVDFPVSIQPPLSTCGGLGAAIHSCPTVDEHGNTVAMIVNDRTVRLYMVPRKSGEEEVSTEAHSIDHELDEGYGCPFSEARWVHNSSSLNITPGDLTQTKGRLIVTSPGGVMDSTMMTDEMFEEVEGGRILLFDFDPEFAGKPGQTYTLTLGKSPPQLLEEAQVDVEQAVAMVRRRTVKQSQTTSLSQRPVTLGRSATTAGNNGRLSRTEGPVLRPNPSRMSMMSIGSMQSDATRSLPDLLEGTDQVQAVDEPYAQNAPRSQALLQRAATNAQRHRYQSLEERAHETGTADFVAGFLSLPEYTEEPNAPLPSRFRALAGLDLPARFSPPRPVVGTDFDSTQRVSPTSSGSRTAPPDIGEHFNADEAFRDAHVRFARSTNVRPPSSSHVADPNLLVDTPVSPTPRPARLSVQSNGGMPVPTQGPSPTRSLQSMPRSLQRAYGNAGYTEVPQPTRTTNIRAAHLAPINPYNVPEAVYLPNGTLSSPRTAATSAAHEAEAWRGFSPFTERGESDEQSSPSLSPGLITSTSRLIPSPNPSQDPINGNNNSPSTTTAAPAYTPRRAVAAANPTVFPLSTAADHVPLPTGRQIHTSPASASTHRITGWHPPAPASPPPTGAGGGGWGGGGGGPGVHRAGSAKSHSHHSRKGSTATGKKGAFASTAKARRLGFFKRRRASRLDPYGRPVRVDMDGNGAGAAQSMYETRSVMTWVTGKTSRAEKCVVM